MDKETLLIIEPQELKFRFEVGKQAYCTIKLYNSSWERVAFKVMTTNPDKFLARPNFGILPPRSRSDVHVTMLGPGEALPDMQCKDKFLIKSVVASPADTIESARQLFNERGRAVEGCKLRVVYVFPSHQRSSNLERSLTGSSFNASNIQGNLNYTERQNTNGGDVGDMFMKGITIGLLSLILWYIIINVLPLIWSLIFMVMVLVVKMTKKLVSDSVEDWIVKTLVYLCVHFFTVVFRRMRRHS